LNPASPSTPARAASPAITASGRTGTGTGSPAR